MKSPEEEYADRIFAGTITPEWAQAKALVAIAFNIGILSQRLEKIQRAIESLNEDGPRDPAIR